MKKTEQEVKLNLAILKAHQYPSQAEIASN
jgi:hypothetical protein